MAGRQVQVLSPRVRRLKNHARVEAKRRAAGSSASPTRRAYNCVQTHWSDEAASAAACERTGGGRPALSRRPSPDPLNSEPQGRVTLATRKGPRGLRPAPMPMSSPAARDLGYEPASNAVAVAVASRRPPHHSEATRWAETPFDGVAALWLLVSIHVAIRDRRRREGRRRGLRRSAVAGATIGANAISAALRIIRTKHSRAS